MRNPLDNKIEYVTVDNKNYRFWSISEPFVRPEHDFIHAKDVDFNVYDHYEYF